MKHLKFRPLLLVSLLSFSLIPTSFAGTVKSPSNPEWPAAQDLKFDGIWVGQGNVTLVKQFDGHVIFQGKDQFSTWSARGVISGNVVTCRGNGVTNSGQQFVYESSMTFKDGALLDVWRVIFADGKELKGEDRLEKVQVKKP